MVKFKVELELAPVLEQYLVISPLPFDEDSFLYAWIVGMKLWCRETHGGVPTGRQITNCLQQDLGYRRTMEKGCVNFMPPKIY